MTILFMSLALFFYSAVALLLAWGVVKFLDGTLGIFISRIDEAVSVWFKAAQMGQNILDSEQARDIERDKFDLAIEAGRQEASQNQDRADMALVSQEQGLQIEAKKAGLVIAENVFDEENGGN